MKKDKNSLLSTAKERAEARERRERAKGILEDFERRRQQRRRYEVNWQLNMNFLMGNQYAYINGRGEIAEGEKEYFWQEREVYNHLAAIIETRLAKLNRVRPVMKVMPFSGEERDIYTAKTSTAILKAVSGRLGMDTIISQATMWSEVCGTAFYKVIWNKSAGSGAAAGTAAKGSGAAKVETGDAEVCVCPPFEIFPDSLTAADFSECTSVIHAKAYPAAEIREMYGIDAGGSHEDVFSVENAVGGTTGYAAVMPKIGVQSKSGYALVIERYTRPREGFPKGSLEIVAAGELVYEGPLPYNAGAGFTPDLPFVRQCAIESPGCFFASSVLERCLPIQRSYNAVKNRKHEFLSRIAMGVLAVEDGSVDTDNLEQEGLSPGKVLVYRQGSQPPVMMNMGSVPVEFSYEEDRLQSEFITVSGVSEIMRNSNVPSSVNSGVALQLLIEQDDTRLSVTAEHIRAAIKRVAQKLLRLYKQFAVTKRVSRIAGDDGVEVLRWSESDIGSDDIEFVTENELNETPSAKRNMVFELLRAGLLQDENGRLSNDMRAKVLDILGYGLWEEGQSLSALHIKRAAAENAELATEYVDPDEIDDHAIHINEHTRFMLSSEFKKIKSNGETRERYYKHLNTHKAAAALAEKAIVAGGAGNG